MMDLDYNVDTKLYKEYRSNIGLGIDKNPSNVHKTWQFINNRFMRCYSIRSQADSDYDYSRLRFEMVFLDARFL